MKRLLAVVFIVLGTSTIFQSSAYAMYEKGGRFYLSGKRVSKRAYEEWQQAQTVVVVGEPVAQVEQGPAFAGVCGKASAVAAALLKGIWNNTWNSNLIVRYPSRVLVLAALWLIGNRFLPAV